MSRSVVFSVSDPSQVGELRRSGVALAKSFGLNETRAGTLGIVLTEAGTNMVKHAGGGQVILNPIEQGSSKAVEILAIDKGPGMTDVAKCMADGYSTAGSPGTGLGAMQRMASCFDIHSVAGKGTVVLAQVWAGPESRNRSTSLITGCVCAPMPGQQACGDGWAVRTSGTRTLVLIVDGLGHGPHAQKASDEAIRLFTQLSLRSGVEMVQSMHTPLRGTRGASLAIADVDHSEKLVRYTGVGNIAGMVWTKGSSRSMVSQNGTVGHELRYVKEFTYVWAPDATLVMHSDGVLSRWNLDGYPGLLLHHPSVVAAVIFRDFRRERDDFTAFVGRDLQGMD